MVGSAGSDDEGNPCFDDLDSLPSSEPDVECSDVASMGSLGDAASPTPTFEVHWQLAGRIRTVEVDDRTVGSLVHRILHPDSNLFDVDLPIPRGGRLFLGDELLTGDKLYWTIEFVYGLMKHLPEPERLLSWVFIHEGVA